MHHDVEILKTTSQLNVRVVGMAWGSATWPALAAWLMLCQPTDQPPNLARKEAQVEQEPTRNSSGSAACAINQCIS